MSGFFRKGRGKLCHIKKSRKKEVRGGGRGEGSKGKSGGGGKKKKKEEGKKGVQWGDRENCQRWYPH